MFRDCGNFAIRWLVAFSMTLDLHLALSWVRAREISVGARASIAVLAILLVCAVFAPLDVPFDPEMIMLTEANAPPLTSISTDGQIVILGTDYLGRDLFARLLFALRNTLFLCGFGVALPTILAIAVWYWITHVSTRRQRIRFLFLPNFGYLLNLFDTFPPVLKALIFVSFVTTGMALGPEQIWISVVLGIAVAETSRLLRAHRSVSGIGAATATAFGSAVMIDASISFIGLGLPSPAPSLGDMVRSGFARAYFNPLPVLIPSLFITLLAVSARTLGHTLERFRADRSARMENPGAQPGQGKLSHH